MSAALDPTALDEVTFDHAAVVAFLTKLFGGLDGYVQICHPRPGGGMVGQCFRTDQLDAAADYAAEVDQTRPTGIYFRVTTMTAPPPPGKRGGAGDTLAIPVMWSDIDFGTEGHAKGETLPPTFDDAVQVAHDAGMGEPSVLIHSGGGAYALWRLDRAVTPEEGGALAKRTQVALLAASERHGWTYGTGVGDLPRVLRLPGTVNRKTANWRPCRVVGGTGRPISPDAIPAPAPRTAAANPVGGNVVALPPRREHDPDRAHGPADVLDELCTWADILEPAGWSRVGVEADGAELWLRPGDPSSPYSARAFAHNIVVHSESAGLPSGAQQRLTRARVYAHLHHGGDLSAAVTALLRGENRGRLAVHVLDALAGARWAPVEPVGTGETVTDDELDLFVATFTRYTDPRRLARRQQWMTADPPDRLPGHARRLLEDVIAGCYPAEHAVRALLDGYRHHGDAAPADPKTTMKAALAAVLTAKVGAR